MQNYSFKCFRATKIITHNFVKFAVRKPSSQPADHQLRSLQKCSFPGEKCLETGFADTTGVCFVSFIFHDLARF